MISDFKKKRLKYSIPVDWKIVTHYTIDKGLIVYKNSSKLTKKQVA